MTETVGFIGLGNMGAPMAERLMAVGYGLVVYDIREEVLRAWTAKGAKSAGSPAEVGTNAQVVFLSLPTPDILEGVILSSDNGVVAGNAVTHLVDLSTTGPVVSARVAAEVRAQGKIFVDSPVSGGVAGARKGTLALMVAALPLHLKRVVPILEVFGKVFHVGQEPGMGQTMKLVNNLLSASALALSSEAIALAVKAGLDPETVVTVCNAGSGRNSATLDKFPRQILPRTFNAGFSLGLMLKDVELCLTQAEDLGLSVPAAQAVRQIWRRAVDEIGAGEDFTKIVTLMENSAGVLIGKGDRKTADG